jgi:hypothetical protein
MFTQSLLPLAAAFLFFVLWLFVRRRDAHTQAGDDFTEFMAVIDDWLRRQGDYQATSHAMNALKEHNGRLMLAKHTLKPRWIGASRNQHYLAEYARCQQRHEALVRGATEDASATALANELEQAIQRLSTLSNGSAN